MIEQITRRKLIGGLGLLFATPAIVRASSLMPVKAFEQPYLLFQFKPSIAQSIVTLTINGVKRDFKFVADGLVRIPCTQGEIIRDVKFTSFCPLAEGGIWA